MGRRTDGQTAGQTGRIYKENISQQYDKCGAHSGSPQLEWLCNGIRGDDVMVLERMM